MYVSDDKAIKIYIGWFFFRTADDQSQLFPFNQKGIKKHVCWI